jgi:hypothetical protein
LVILAPPRRRRTRANPGTQTNSGAACAARHHPMAATPTTRTSRRQTKNRYPWALQCVHDPQFAVQPRACGSPTRTSFLHEDPHRGHATNFRSIAVCAPDPRHNLIAPGDSTRMQLAHLLLPGDNKLPLSRTMSGPGLFTCRWLHSHAYKPDRDSTVGDLYSDFL